MRFYFPEIRSNGFHAFRIINGNSSEEIEVSNHSFKNMVERKEAQGTVPRTKTGHGGDNIGDNIPVGKHHAFRNAGSS